jgi:exopolysaccharide production protein ExoZ
MIQNIQILRFAAALWVVLFHMLQPIVVPPEYQPEWPSWLRGTFLLGFAGVDLFFVISGAVIAENTRGFVAGTAAVRRFIAVRLCRIYVGWWPIFFAYLAAFHWWDWPLADKNVLGSFLLWPLTDVVSYVLPILWTLSMEIYFYLVVGLLLWLPRPAMRKALGLWALLVLATMAYEAAAGRYSVPRYQDLSVYQLYIASPFVLEFIAGFLLCDLVRARPRLPLWPWPVAAATFAGLAAAAHFGAELYQHGLAEFVHAPLRVLLFGGMSAALVVSALLAPAPVRRLPLALARLGDASYALYLGHILLLVLLYVVPRAFGWPGDLAWVLWGAALALVNLAAWLHHRTIEHPLYRATRRRVENALA